MTAEHILFDVPRILVALFACVLAPLALRVVGLPRLALATVGSGALVAIALWLPAGAIATLLTAPYVLTASVAGLYGVRRLLARWTEAPQLAMAAGLVGLAGASVWVVAHRANIALLDYPPFWVLLTAAHFHVGATFLPIILGWSTLGRGRLARLSAVGCVVGFPLTAAGIYVGAPLETIGALVMAASALGGAVVLLTSRELLLRIAALPLAAGMVLAGMYALRSHGTALVLGTLDPLSSMILTHGLLDTVFALLALTAIAQRRDLRVRDAPPLSRLRGSLPIGATFFQRTKLERDTPAHGLVDTVADLDIDPATLAPAIRAFYEQTGAHELIVRPHWRAGFRTGSRLWAAIARKLGQLQLPVAAESGREGIASRIVAIDGTADGRRGPRAPVSSDHARGTSEPRAPVSSDHARGTSEPRAWIRTYPDGRALYVAAYATHRDSAHAYMNIAFPLPLGNLSSVLRMIPSGAGVSVSTRLGGDCGIWLVVLGVPLRLPLSETIDVWTVDDPAAPADLRSWAAGYTTIARHDLWLFGAHYLTLDYAMRPNATNARAVAGRRAPW